VQIVRIGDMVDIAIEVRVQNVMYRSQRYRSTYVEDPSGDVRGDEVGYRVLTTD
jgi:hypothetical protein